VLRNATVLRSGRKKEWGRKGRPAASPLPHQSNPNRQRRHNQLCKKIKKETKQKRKTKVRAPITSEETASTAKSGLTHRQEKFCKLFVYGDREHYGNGTLCYLEAYGITYGFDEDDEDEEEPIKLKQNVAAAAASRLLRNVKIINRINELLQEGGFNDTNVDRQHLFLINQFGDLKTKLGAIKEYNVLKRRVDGPKVEVNLFTPTEEERQKSQAAITDFLKTLSKST
jgi:hypothetical protein